MAEPRSTHGPSTAARTLRLFGMNLLILGGAMVLLWLGYRLLHHPRVSSPPVAVPADLVAGDAPGPLGSGPYRLTLHGARWIAQDSLPPDLRLSFRARPGPTVDYLVLDVSVRDAGERPAPLTYDGAAQDVRLLLSSTDPVSFYTEPLSPQEARIVAREEALANGTLAPGAARRGVLVYAVERFRRRWSLWFLPPPPDVAPEEGPQQPAIAMRFAP